MSTRSSKHSDQFTRAPTIITDGNHVAKMTSLILGDAFEDVDEVVCGASAGEDDNTAGLSP